MVQIYRRYFIYLDSGWKRLQIFLEKLNKFHPNINVTHESDKENISFLELNVKLSEGQLKTDFCTKPTDRHQHLHYSSSHPEHNNIRYIVFSQSLRVSRTCSFEKDFRKNTMEMKSWFLKRGYPKILVEKEMGKVKVSNKVGDKQQNEKGIPFFVTYHPTVKNIGNIIKKNLYLLYMNEEAEKVFTPGPSFPSARKLSSYLVRAKLYLIDRTVGSFKCSEKRCQTCLNVNETDTFTSASTGETFKINRQFKCNRKCLVYLLTCKVCFDQYLV